MTGQPQTVTSGAPRAKETVVTLTAGSEELAGQAAVLWAGELGLVHPSFGPPARLKSGTYAVAVGYDCDCGKGEWCPDYGTNARVGQPYGEPFRLGFLALIVHPGRPAEYLSAEIPEGGLGYIEEYIGEDVDWHIIETASSREMEGLPE